MFVRTITYTDFNGDKRTEEFRFHFNKSELLQMEMATEGGFSARVDRIIKANNQPELMKLMKSFLLDAYGVKSDDGRRFMKSPEISREFEECPAFDIIFTEMTIGKDAAKAAADFINGVTPEGMSKPMAEVN